MESTVDCKHGIVTGVDVYGANEKESIQVLRHLDKQIKLGVPMRNIALDRGYETGAVHRGLELLGLLAISPQFSSPIPLKSTAFLTTWSEIHLFVRKECLLLTTG
jgi:hypothetical protein